MLGPVEEEYVELTLDEIMNGKGELFPGLLGVVNAYLSSLNVDVETRCSLGRYLDLLKNRSNGELTSNPNRPFYRVILKN